MPVIYLVCGGIDGHAAQLTAFLRRVSDDGQITTALIDGGTMTNPDWTCCRSIPRVTAWLTSYLRAQPTNRAAGQWAG